MTSTRPFWASTTSWKMKAKVDELIGSNIKKLNRELVLNCLSNYEAMQVLNIPLSFRLLDDRLVWHKEKDGQYYVRSAYMP